MTSRPDLGTDRMASPWAIGAVARRRGGRVIVPREYAPLARHLPYRRAAGEAPMHTGGTWALRRLGWSVVLGDRRLGEVLLALALVRALAEGTRSDLELRYQGSRPRLMRRCRLPLIASVGDGPHIVHSSAGQGRLRFSAEPERPEAWLDVLADGQVEVHAALPMRYYLAAEQALGVRLPADHAPVPPFAANEHVRPFHIVFIAATSWPSRKDYGVAGFDRIARILTERRAAPWTFTLIPGGEGQPPEHPRIQVLAGLDAVDCLDVLASAELVIGNDTGLTHLAALTERPDGTRPHVIGLYGRHAYSKWTTGGEQHHAVATSFSQMLAAADRCPVRDQLDDALWSDSANLAALPAELVADFAGEVAGWW